MLMLNTLQNFAEVGVAIMGFSGIVTALYSRSEVAWTPRERDHLLSLLQTSAMVVAFALVPQVLIAYFDEGRVLWLQASSLYLFAHLTHYFLVAKKMRRAISLNRSYSIRKRDAIVSGAVASILIIGQALAIIYGSVTQMHFAYLVVLFWHTASAVLMFCTLLIRVMPKPAPTAKPARKPL